MPTVELTTFSFKVGPPANADLILDVRALPNPFYNRELQALNGTDAAVAAFFALQEETAPLLAASRATAEEAIAQVLERGERTVRIAVGCTGGQHRSVYIAEQLATQFRAAGYPVTVFHRELCAR